MATHQIDIQALRTPEEIEQVRHFLYRAYVIDMRWKPAKGNPSKQSIRLKNGVWILQDKYDKVSRWFGAYHAGELTGCCRLCTRLEGSFEVEHYQALPAIILQQDPLYEFNRFAFKNDHFADDLFLHFMQTVFELAIEEDFVFFSTTGMNNRKDFEKIGMHIFGQTPFRYHPTDRYSVDFTYFLPDEKQLIWRNCNTILGRA